jgi:hypothetical protein
MESNNNNKPLSKRAKKRLNNRTNKSIQLGITTSQVSRESMNETQYKKYHQRELDFYATKCSQNPNLDSSLVEVLCESVPKKYPKISQQVFEEVKKQYETNLSNTLAVFFQNIVQVDNTEQIEISSSSDEESSSSSIELIGATVAVDIVYEKLSPFSYLHHPSPLSSSSSSFSYFSSYFSFSRHCN